MIIPSMDGVEKYVLELEPMNIMFLPIIIIKENITRKGQKMKVI